MKRKCTTCNRACKELQGTKRRVCDRCQKAKRRVTDRRSHIARYGLTAEDYERLRDHQGDRCPIFNNKPGRRELDVDHDHASGLVRGLLSRRANKILAQVGDDPALLRALADYLENPPAQVLGIEARYQK